MVSSENRRDIALSSGVIGSVRRRRPEFRCSRSRSATASASRASRSPPRASFSALSRARVRRTPGPPARARSGSSRCRRPDRAPAGDVGDVRVLEAAHDLDDRVDLADVLEELVAQTLSLSRRLDQAGDVHELDGRRDDPRGLRDPGERLEPLVGHRDDADVRLDRAERVVRRLGLSRARERVEERAISRRWAVRRFRLGASAASSELSSGRVGGLPPAGEGLLPERSLRRPEVIRLYRRAAAWFTPCGGRAARDDSPCSDPRC